ncbi:isoleucine--tRNA ligase [Limisphaera sp. VF-2]|uniref:isoleucine--tRNA ligase n=1 Tax=Limisphaera sp. VF-2 TaxID=3400418 RepID=UPI003C1AB76F
MDYKNTLNLPRTEFPMKADLVVREPERLKQWQAARLYERIQAARAQAPAFVLHDGPPFANGDVHIGTALNKILKDFILKYKTLRGYRAPYVPGWDCHGLPIEFKVVQERRTSSAPATDPAEIRRACEAYARRFVELQRQQFQRLGVLGDWENPYLTLDPAYEAEELRLFADLVEQGMVYRGKKPVYWSIPCRTALAEAEVEYQEHVSQSVYVKFPVVGRPGVYLLIWTTTPWTLPANLAVAYNSTFSYAVVRVGQEDYILSAMLVNTVASKCGWTDFQIVRHLDGGHLQHVEYQHPFCQRTGRLFPGDSFVDNVTGTGFVHIAPGHGLEDYLLGLEHGLPIYSPVDDDGRFTWTDDLPREAQMPAALIGKSILEKHGRSEANEAVLHELRVRKLLLHEENYRHSYPHCWRSKTPVIFRAMHQWFIRLDHVPPGSPPGTPTFRERALAEIEKVTWIPDWGKTRIAAAVKARPDWCISRQRAWGVPIPAFFDAEGRPILDPAIVRNTARLVETHGSNIWFEQTAAELWARVRPAHWTGPDPVAKSTDTLDVWIDSGSSSRAVIARRPELRGHPLPFQCDLYLEGSDQHRGWFQSSLLLSLAAQGAAPYRTVLTHGFMVDADREKISKSRQSQGGYEKPQTAEAYVQKWGADIVRLWVASQDFRSDIVVSEDRLAKVAETYRVLRNALRYQLSNLYDFDPARHAVPDEALTGLDRWILDAFAKLEAEVLAAYDRYEFHVVYQKVSQFVAVELSAIYHDIIKDRLYTEAADAPRRRSTQTALWRLVQGLCRMLAPILAFTADEAWEQIPGRPPGSVHEQIWQPSPLHRSPAEVEAWDALFQLRDRLLPELEKARQAKVIGKSLEARVILRGRDPLYLNAKTHLAAFRELLNVSQLEIETEGDGVVPVQVVRASGEKCERCWHWETDVGTHPEHPTLCGRCVAAVEALRPNSPAPPCA